jgi:hypothetical protein
MGQKASNLKPEELDDLSNNTLFSKAEIEQW